MNSLSENRKPNIFAKTRVLFTRLKSSRSSVCGVQCLDSKNRKGFNHMDRTFKNIYSIIIYNLKKKENKCDLFVCNERFSVWIHLEKDYQDNWSFLSLFNPTSFNLILSKHFNRHILIVGKGCSHCDFFIKVKRNSKLVKYIVNQNTTEEEKQSALWDWVRVALAQVHQ